MVLVFRVEEILIVGQEPGQRDYSRPRQSSQSAALILGDLRSTCSVLGFARALGDWKLTNPAVCLVHSSLGAELKRSNGPTEPQASEG